MPVWSQRNFLGYCEFVIDDELDKFCVASKGRKPTPEERRLVVDYAMKRILETRRKSAGSYVEFLKLAHEEMSRYGR